MLNLPLASCHTGKLSPAPANRPCAPHPFLLCSCFLVSFQLLHIFPYWIPRRRDNNVLLSVFPHVAQDMVNAITAMTNKTWFCIQVQQLSGMTSISIYRSLPLRHTGLEVGFFFRDPQKVFSRIEKQKPRRLFPLNSLLRGRPQRGASYFGLQ